MALWYAHTGPWWDLTNVRDNDGISVQEQEEDTASLWNYYRRLIALRKGTPALRRGDFKAVRAENRDVLAFTRHLASEGPGQRVLVLVNCAPEQEHVRLGRELVGDVRGVLFDGGLRTGTELSRGGTVVLSPGACAVFDVR